MKFRAPLIDLDLLHRPFTRLPTVTRSLDNNDHAVAEHGLMGHILVCNANQPVTIKDRAGPEVIHRIAGNIENQYSSIGEALIWRNGDHLALGLVERIDLSERAGLCFADKCPGHQAPRCGHQLAAFNFNTVSEPQ